VLKYLIGWSIGIINLVVTIFLEVRRNKKEQEKIDAG
jgi:hypothetical protein